MFKLHAFHMNDDSLVVTIANYGLSTSYMCVVKQSDLFLEIIQKLKLTSRVSLK